MTACHICGFHGVEQLAREGTPFRLVSSDVRPASGIAEFSICPRCLAVQKAITPAWRAMADEIYASYDINHQSHGAEPTIFDSTRGSGPRSLILLRSFLDTVELTETGRLLDIGCSNGNLLKSFHAVRPAWKLSGSELQEQWQDVVLSLPGVEAFYCGRSPDYADLFDVISLSHVLEHVPDPIGFLKTISSHLTTRGRLLVASPDLRQNPADLVIADHCSHFEEDSLAYVAKAAGLYIEHLSTTMLPKELVAVLSRRPATSEEGGEGGADDQRRSGARQRCRYYFDLLDQVRKAARSCSVAGRPFGIMGSSIAACWTMLELEGKVDFFVDEDQNRLGHELEGQPILGPAQIPSGAVVFIPMSVSVAEKIIQRWRHLPVDFRYVASNRPA